MVLPFVVPPATLPPATDLPELPQSPAVHSTDTGRSHTVRAGETLYDIADRYGTTVSAISARNHLDGGFIHPGQRLRLPSSSSAGHTTTRADRPARTSSTRGYTVRAGDTLSGIAARHDMPVTRLSSLNSLSADSFIRPGQHLRVEGGAARPAKRSTARARISTTSTTRTSGATHTVRSGETLSGIADRYGMSVTRLAKLNRTSTTAFIQPGQRLRVTGHGSTTRRSSTQRSSSADHDHNSFAGRTYSSSIVSAAARNRQTLAGRAVPSRTEVRAKVAATARRYGVDPDLALAISYQESGWDQRQVSVANAVGVMQVIPSSGEWASSIAGRDLDLLDTDDNITAGVILLQQLTRMASSDSQVIGGYYQGLGSVQEHGLYADTKQYVANVRHHRARM